MYAYLSNNKQRSTKDFAIITGVLPGGFAPPAVNHHHPVHASGLLSYHTIPTPARYCRPTKNQLSLMMLRFQVAAMPHATYKSERMDR
jgi:hypothetical protein